MTVKYTLDTKNLKLHKLDPNIVQATLQIDNEDMISMYKDLLTIRHLENNSQALFDKKLIRGFCHLVTGQENIYVAYKHAKNEDVSTSSYRCHGLAYVNGSSIVDIFSELLGRKNKIAGGKGGSMHLYNDYFLGGHGIVGASVPIRVGAAFSCKYCEINKIKVDKNKNEILELLIMVYLTKQQQ